MAHSTLVSSSFAGQHYTHTLASAYRRFAFLTDPDFATQNEIEAWNKIRRDAVIAHAIQKRRQGVAGLNYQMVPASDEPQDKRAAEITGDIVDETPRLQHVRFNLAEAIFRGSSWAYICGRRRPFAPTGTRTRPMWVPDRIEHIDRFRMRIRRVDDREDDRIRTIWEMFSIKREEWEEVRSPEAFIMHSYDQTEDTIGYGRGLLQSIFFFWRAKEIILTQGLSGVERWAQGLLHAEVDGLREGSTGRINDNIVDEWLDQLAKQRSEHVLVSDKLDKLTVHQGPGQGHDMVIDFLKYLDQGIDRLILTSTLPTGGGDQSGSLARSQTEENQLESTLQADRAALSETIDNSLVKLIWSRNQDSIQEILREEGLQPARRPRFKIMQETVEDPEKNMRIAAMALRAGIPLKKQEVFEKIQYTPPQDGDEVIMPITAPTQPQLPPPFGDSDVPVREFIARARIGIYQGKGNANGSPPKSR